jgi:hypothetical protein
MRLNFLVAVALLKKLCNSKTITSGEPKCGFYQFSINENKFKIDSIIIGLLRVFPFQIQNISPTLPHPSINDSPHSNPVSDREYKSYKSLFVIN